MCKIDLGNSRIDTGEMVHGANVWLPAAGRRRAESRVLADGLGRASEDNSLQKVQRTINFMVANLNRPLQVAMLAAQANVSPSHFFALFKQRTGYPPMDYFTKLRMRHACRLLDSSTARVKEVAAAVGYDDPFYFSRVFKSVSAMAPVHYRGLGIDMRREIKNLLEPKEQHRSGKREGRSRTGGLAGKTI